MKLTHLFEAQIKWTDLVKKYNMVNGPRYHDTGTSPKLIKNEKGVVLVQIDKDGSEFFVYVEKVGKNKALREKFTDLNQLDQFLSTIDLGAGHQVSSDAEILKFINKEYMVKVKSLDDLKKNWFYTKYSKSIQLQDKENVAVYLHLTDGSGHGDDTAGVGSLGMSLNDFIEWLDKNGVKKQAKPKRKASYSYYD
jgi:hypothetical protein